MHDTALEDLCRKRPRSLRELLAVTGFGERRSEMYGSEIFAAFDRFESGARASAAQLSVPGAADETLRLLAEGKNFEQIAEIRGRRRETVVGRVAELIEKGQLAYNPAWVDPAHAEQIEAACARLGTQWLKPLKEAVAPEVTFEEIRLVVAKLRRAASPAA
jgi:ATP-dependent DNA helicase RecQ